MINSIKIGDVTVTASPTAKNLGATFDDTMSLKPHVNALVKSCNFQLRSIGQARKFLTKDATEKVLHAFISSRLDNGNSLLCRLPDYIVGKLQRVQNTAARILTRTRKCDHISPVLRSLHWLPVAQRIQFKILTLTFKCLHNKAPQYLMDLIKTHDQASDRGNMRSSNKFLLKLPDSNHPTMGDRSFAVAAPTLWNDLPLEIRSCDTFETFKSKLKTYLFAKES